jgi:hypothetical protein
MGCSLELRSFAFFFFSILSNQASQSVSLIAWPVSRLYSLKIAKQCDRLTLSTPQKKNYNAYNPLTQHNFHILSPFLSNK